MSKGPTLTQILDMLVESGHLHAGQKQDVLNRGKEQARHLLLDRRQELRRLLGRQRVSYTISDIELIANFRFRRDDKSAPLDEEQITEVVARAQGYPFVRIDPLQLNFKLVVEAFGGPFAEKHLVIAVDDRPDALTVALCDPWNTDLLGSLAQFKKKAIRPVMACKSEILKVIAEFHGFRRSMRAAEADFASDLPDIANLESLYKVQGTNELEATDQPVVQAVWYLLNYAFDNRASDIHIEPKRDDALVRMRIDGVLHSVHRMPRGVHPAIISRVKLLSRLDIAERRRPQDGRFKTTFGNTEVEMRVSTVPTVFGEKAVLRIFDPSVLKQPLGDLGFFEAELNQYNQMIGATNGMVLITGPTGSGKTTTLYSTLSELNKTSHNISTAEDPIEYNLYGINQVQMHEEIGLNFAASLRCFLRQDPDVIMVGEIRDFETAEIAVKAALTGHLVLSTLHTNDAPSTVSRLLNMGIEPFLVASSVNLIGAQRLLRKVCYECKAPFEVPRQQLIDVGIPPEEVADIKAFKGTGCRICNNTGYKGRIAVYEIMIFNEELKEFVLNGASTLELKREAVRQGMKTLRASAITKFKDGMTTIDEIVRVTAPD